MLYLILLTLWFHKNFKLIFPKSSSWPKTMYIYWTLEKTSMGNFLGKFSYTFGTIILWSTYEQLLTWICYCVSNQKQVLTGYFGFLFWFSSAILFSKMKLLFSTFIPVLREFLHYYFNCLLILTSLTYYHWKCVQIYKLKDLR